MSRGALPTDGAKRARLSSRSWFGPVVVVCAAALAALVAIPLGGASSGVLASLRADVAPKPAARPSQPARLTAFAHLDSSGGMDMLLLAGVGRDARRATVVLVPTSTLVEVPSYGSRPISDLPFAGNSFATTTTLENALGVELSELRLVDDAALAKMIGPAGEISVDLPNAVEVDGASGTVSIPAGTQRISADQAALLIGADEKPEVEHLVTVQAVMDGWRDAMRRDRSAAKAAGPLARLATVAVRYESLPVDQLSAGSTERYQLRRRSSEALMREAFAWTLLAGGNVRPRVELLNGFGAVGVTQEVAEHIVPAGGDVRLTGNVPGFGVKETRVVYYRDESRTAAEQMLRALGVGKIARGEQPVDVVDVTVVVGSDWAGAR